MAKRDPRRDSFHTEEYDQNNPIDAMFVDEFLTNYQHFKGMLHLEIETVFHLDLFIHFFKVMREI